MMQELELLENKCKTLSSSSFPEAGSHSLTTSLEAIGRERDLAPQAPQVLQGGEILAVQAAHHDVRLEIPSEEAVVGEEASVQEWQFSAPMLMPVPIPMSPSSSSSPSRAVSAAAPSASAAAATPPAATTVSPTGSRFISTSTLTPSMAAAAAAAAAATEDELKAKMKSIGRRTLIEEDASQN